MHYCWKNYNPHLTMDGPFPCYAAQETRSSLQVFHSINIKRLFIDNCFYWFCYISAILNESRQFPYIYVNLFSINTDRLYLTDIFFTMSEMSKFERACLVFKNTWPAQ